MKYTKDRLTRQLTALVPAVVLLASGAPAQTGRLDFLKAKDSSFALFANTSATFQTGSLYPNEVVLITGLPSNPVIAARVDIGVDKPLCSPGEPCGNIRSIALSPDGDTALVSSDPSGIQPPGDRGVSTLFVLRNVRAFVRSKNPGDLRIRKFRATDHPQLDNVSGLAFGPDGRWAVVNTIGPGPIDLTYKSARGTLVTITGLPDNPVFSAPFQIPSHSQGNIDLSVDGETLVMNDVTNNTGPRTASSQILVKGLRPGGFPPQIVGTASFEAPENAIAATPVVRDARLSVDGRFVLAPSALILSLGPPPVGRSQIEILGPPRNGKLPLVRELTPADGAEGGPYVAAVSPDGDSALIVNTLDQGGAKLLTGLGSGDPSKFQLKALPFAFFGPPFPLGPNGPPVFASHVEPKFTPDGETALVTSWINPGLVGLPLLPSISVLTGFRNGPIRVVSHLSSPTLNTFDYSTLIATVPTGLQDYVNLYLPAGAARNLLTSLLQDAIAKADRGDTTSSIVALVGFIGAAYGLEHQGILSSGRTSTLVSQAGIGIQVLLTHP